MATGRGGSNKLSKNKRTETQKTNLAHQPMKTLANRARKKAKHARLHPNDKQGIQGGPNEGTAKLQHMSAQQRGKQQTWMGRVSGQETVADHKRPQRFKQVNEEHLGLVRISAATLLKMQEYKNILLGQKQTLAEANEQFSTDPLK